MPELPEVETVCRALHADLAGGVIADIVPYREGLRAPFPGDMAARLRGRRVVSVARRAKYILIAFDGPDLLVLHLGMSGSIRVYAAGCHEKPGKHDHLMILMRGGLRMLFNDPRRFGTAFLVKAHALDGHPAFKRLGPEPLEKGFSGPVLKAALGRKKAAIKPVLLDQHIVAGVGNIYACEALFQAGIDPTRRASSLTEGEAERLALCIRRVLKSAIKAGGSTLRDYRHTDGKTGYFQQKLGVYGREGQPCAGCVCDVARTGGVVRINQGGRSTFYCPRRQG